MRSIILEKEYLCTLMKKIIQSISFFAFCFIVWSNAFSQNDTLKHFSLNDTVFEVGSIYFFEVYFKHTRHYDYYKGEEIPSIIGFLKTHKNLSVQIGFHTDMRPIAMTNDTLSKIRAEGLMDYFIKEGVDAERMVPFGYGSNMPRVLEKDTCVVWSHKEYCFSEGTILNKEYIESIYDRDMREAAHSLNRRAELKIVRVD
jgi:hypothetical protein